MRNISIPSRIFWAVCIVHLSFILPMLFKSPKDPTKKQHKSIVVKTISAPSILVAEKKNIPTVQPTSKKSNADQTAKKPSAVSPLPAVKKAESKALKNTHKNPPLKKEMPKTNPSPLKEKKIPDRKTSLSSSQPNSSILGSLSPSLLKQLEESLAKIQDQSNTQQQTQKTNAKFALPLTASALLQIDRPHSSKEEVKIESSNYIETLVRQLHVSLHLPDIGEVKIELTLRQDGTVAKLKVLNAESQQNRKYLEAELPRLRFPHLSGSYAPEKEHTFILNFCSES